MMMKAPRQILSLATAILLLVAGIAAAAEERPVIGALLPLTGKQAALGNRILDGLIAGIGLFDGKRAAPVALQIENYGSDPAAAGRSVLAIWQISDEGTARPPMPMAGRVMTAAMAGAPETPISSGEIEVRARVTLTVLLK